MTSTALITIVHGRHDHLAGQYRALAMSTVALDDVVLVAIDDREVENTSYDPIRPRIVRMPAGRHGLPLAAARNAGAHAALEAGAGVLVFLDVDCIPAPGLVEAYSAAARDARWSNRLLCGPVSYLPPAPPAGYELAALERSAEPHAARPAPPPGRIVDGGDPSLFWSLSFAVTADTWRAIGGFCERYEGYGGEDTDFAMLARAAGIDLAWVGSARAFHQYHPTEDPPAHHLDDIVRNATLYFERWGRWPMEGWLAAFQRAGLVRWSATALELVPPAKP